MTAAHRAGKSALDDFLPELNVPFDDQHARLDPRDVHIESIEVASGPARPPQATSMPHKSTVQWWPMFAAALIGMGVSLMALAAWARFGNF